MFSRGLETVPSSIVVAVKQPSALHIRIDKPMRTPLAFEIEIMMQYCGW